MKRLLSLCIAAVMLACILMITAVASAEEITDLHVTETQARELNTWNILYTERAEDGEVLANLFDGFLTNDKHGNLIPCAAKQWSSDDDGQTWKFTLNDGMKWTDSTGAVKADVKAEDWLWGLEWVLNFAKNDSYNTSMPCEMIEGAKEYADYTRELVSQGKTDEAKALKLDKFLETVKIEAPDDRTVIYHCKSKFPYFPTVATSNCLMPVSKDLLESIGVDAFKGVKWDQNWYNGPYIVTSFINGNEKILTANPNYYNPNVKRFKTITIRMVEDINKEYELFQTGEADEIVGLTESQLKTISSNPNHEWYNYLVEQKTRPFSYQMHFCYDVRNDDNTPDTNWNTAVANLAFRQSMYYGLDMTKYLARSNALDPLSDENYAYTANNVCKTSDGKDYTQLVLDKIGLQYSKEKYNRYDPEKAAALKKQAMEELTAKGVTFPVTIKYYISGASQTAKDSADVLKQIFSECLGDDYVKLEIKTYVASLQNEVIKPQHGCIYFNGWAADFADPINFLRQETYGEPEAYYSNNYSMINNATDEELISEYKEYTRLVNEANAINDNMDARYNAMAKAEAYMIEHCFVIPNSRETLWSLTCINPYSKIDVAYGYQVYRYVNYETNKDVYTTEEIEQKKAEFEAEQGKAF